MTDIAKTRLLSQQIEKTAFTSAKQVVGWMGAMQAQDYANVKWAVGARLPNSTERAVEAAISAGEIIRTHLLRPTWHLVSADDLRWMLELSAPHVRAGVKSRHKVLELTEALIGQSNAIIEKSLRGGRQLTRGELMTELERAGLDTDENRSAHFLMRAELDGIICSGGDQTYALLDERVPASRPVGREAALALLASRYFASHGPATLQDFTWWSGLPAGDARQALELVKADFISETIEARVYWFSNLAAGPKADTQDLYLLPAFDEFVISYQNRSASLPFEDRNKSVSNNGIFRPMIVVNGQVVGIWKRSIRKDKVSVEAEFFRPPSPSTAAMVEKAAAQFGSFLEKKAEVGYKQ